MTTGNSRVIFDTNVWISFLIGKRLASLETHIANRRITVITTEQLINEIVAVAGRERMKKYFPSQKVSELIELLALIAENIDITPIHSINRDPKDNFLLDLIEFSKADFLVTGDKDLLVLNPFKTATILSPADFEKELEKV